MLCVVSTVEGVAVALTGSATGVVMLEVTTAGVCIEERIAAAAVSAVEYSAVASRYVLVVGVDVAVGYVVTLAAVTEM